MFGKWPPVGKDVVKRGTAYISTFLTDSSGEHQYKCAYCYNILQCSHLLNLHGRIVDIYVDFRRMPIETRRGKLDSTTAKPDTTKTTMVTPEVSTNRKPDEADPDIEARQRSTPTNLEQPKIVRNEIGRTVLKINQTGK